MSKKHVFLQFFSKITLFACVFCAFFISPAFATLPTGYTELEYIESTGTQYIDTGIQGKNGITIETEAIPIAGAGSTYPMFFGARESSSNVRFGVCWNYQNKLDYMLLTDQDTGVPLVYGSKYDIQITTNSTGATATINGNSQTFEGAITSSTAPSIWLFCQHSVYLTPQNNNPSATRLYFFRVSNTYTSEVMQNLIPARRNSDGEVGMYDTVSGTFFENAGTGDFIAGPVANCKTFGTDGVTCTECEPDYILNNDGGCSGQIKIATTKYVDDEFAPLNTALANAISVVDNVVTQTIAQATAIGELQNTKQTRPSDDNECPAGKKCLLVTDENGVPHWYPIVESILPDAYTQLEYIESTGTQYIDTGLTYNYDEMVSVEFEPSAESFTKFGVVMGTNTGYQVVVTSTSANSYYSSFYSSSSNTKSYTKSGRLMVRIENRHLYVDNVDKGKLQALSSPTLGFVHLFSFVNGGSTGIGKIYNATIGNRAKLVPAKRNSDGKVGMYDTVSGTFFENAGTGDFIGGAPVF